MFVKKKNYGERSFTDALETFQLLICQPDFICRSGFDAQKAAEFPQHQTENLLVI